MDSINKYLGEGIQNTEIDSMYVIIGFLNEYAGGYFLDTRMVDKFYVDESKKAQIFKKLCEHYLAVAQHKNDVTYEQENNGLSYIMSETICEQIKEYYSPMTKEHYLPKGLVGQLSEKGDLYTTEESHDSKMKKYSFLLGVMIRNKVKNQPVISFANATHKAKLFIKILIEFDNFGDTPTPIFRKGIPYSTTITLSENNPIWNEIDQYTSKLLAQASAT